MHSKKRTHQQMRHGSSRSGTGAIHYQHGLHGQQQRSRQSAPSVSKFPTQFSRPSEKLVIDFLEAIRTPGTPFSSLQLFSEALEKDGKDLVGVLCRRTSGTEVTSLLAAATKLKAPDIALIFTILERIVLTIVSELDALESFALEMAEQLLTKHVRTFYYMLKTTNKSNQIKSALKLLISLCTLGNRTVKLLATHFSFSACSFSALVSRRNTVDPQDVRALTVHLLVAIMMFGDNFAIRHLAQAKNVIAAVFPGMIVDRPEIVQLLLSTLLDKVVKNSSISKTMKIQLFNQTTLRQLLKVLAWNGHRKSEKEFNENEVVPASTVDARDSVRDAMMQFLLVVCTSTKFGIVFQDPLLGNSSKNANHILTEVMRTLVPTSVYHRSLMRAVLLAAPDQVVHLLVSWKPAFMPRNSDNWFLMINWLSEVYDGFDVVSRLGSIPAKSVVQPSMMLVLPPWMDKDFQREVFASTVHSSVSEAFTSFLEKALVRAYKIMLILPAKDKSEFLKLLPDKFVDDQIVTAYLSDAKVLGQNLSRFLELYAIILDTSVPNHPEPVENRAAIKQDMQQLLMIAESSVRSQVKEVAVDINDPAIQKQKERMAAHLAATVLRNELTEFLLEISYTNRQGVRGPFLDLLLNAYGATLSLSDQNIYKALTIAEASADVANKEVFALFGKLAQRQQQVRMGQGVALPHTTLREFVDNLDRSMLVLTALHFPIQLCLGSTTAPVIDSRIYDPRYLLTNFGMLLPRPKFNIIHFVESGCLGVVVAALGSLDQAMRDAAGFCLCRLEEQVQELGFRLKEQLLCVLSQIRRASRSGKPWPHLWTVLLTRFFVSFFEDQNHNRQMIMEFFLVKPDFNLESVPEFLKLFESSELSHMKDRKFVLDIIKHGVRQYRDFEICRHSHVFEAVLAMYGSPLSNKAQNQQVAEVLEAVSAVPYVGRALIKQFGLFSWLTHALSGDEEPLISLLHCAANCMGDTLFARPVNRAYFRSHGLLLLHPLLKIGEDFVKHVKILEVILIFVLRLLLLNTLDMGTADSHFGWENVSAVVRLLCHYMQLTGFGKEPHHPQLPKLSSFVSKLKKKSNSSLDVALVEDLSRLLCSALNMPADADLFLD
ncbi:uncharacterized protein LOC129588128 [Paramacrobiotus metropolitanus]|uniref:uncharacterized protein LOC129588128 n=1 Tax=Paramacrobiotus metropolitanus TaxID=2943436 RepID=UPI002446096E|nr:uncharacterized protein LOC129588128 [Paramacrobiotus metropolitanus]